MKALLLSFFLLYNDYMEAYNKAIAEKKQFVVMVGAEWCQACHKMKANLKNLNLKDRVFYYLDYDEEREIFEGFKLDNKTLPKLLIFDKKDGKWNRKVMTGVFSEGTIRKQLDSEQVVNEKKIWIKE